MKTLLAVLLMFAASGAGAQERRRVDVDETLPEVMAEFEAAWNKQDAKAMSELWNENGDLIDASGKRANGKDEIVKLLEEQLAGPLKGTTVAIKVQSWQALVRGIIFADAQAVVSGLKDAKGKDLPPFTLHFSMTAQARRGTLWLVNVRYFKFAAG